MITEVAPTPPPYFLGIILKTRTAAEKLKGLSNETSKQNKTNNYPDELEAWRKESYTIGILCINADNNEMIVVDPEGHSYARYVGFVS